uniref:TRAF-type domain-containing protein n=1 Tax=Strigamia maritima TaxID=126957 RepID=T1JD64_STRMM
MLIVEPERGSCIDMDSESFICLKCGFKNLVLTTQMHGGIYCQRCGAKTDLTDKFACLLENYGLPGIPTCVVQSYSCPEKGFCTYCNTAVDLVKIQSHYDNCDMYPIICQLCNRKFIRRTIKIHMQDCSRTLRWCKFSPIGCQFQGTPAEIELHEGDNVHNELMMKLLLNLQHEQTCNASMIIRSSNERLSSVTVSTQYNLDELLERNSTTSFESRLNNLGHDLKMLQNDCCNNIKGNPNYIETINKQQAMEINLCRQQVTKLELKQSQLLEQNTQLEQRYGGVNEMLDQLAKKIQKLKHTIGFKIDSLITQQAEQSEKIQYYENTLAALIKSN